MEGCSELDLHGRQMIPPRATRQPSRSYTHGQTTFVLTGHPSAYDIPVFPYTLLCPLRLLTCAVSHPQYTSYLKPALCVGYITFTTQLNEHGFIITCTITFLAEKRSETLK
uniref:Transposon Ty3-I Gag-Pol polyprotein n=1 Tax=Schistocephalus solidus TaxID=70667 RepID=A0A0X3PFD8_SCHSO